MLIVIIKAKLIFEFNFRYNLFKVFIILAVLLGLIINQPLQKNKLPPENA